MHYSTEQEISRLINNKGKEVGIEILKGKECTLFSPAVPIYTMAVRV